MKDIIIKKNTDVGRAICDKAASVGISPAALLAGVCINAMENDSNPLLPAPQPARERQPELPLEPTQPAQVKPAGSAGMLAGVA